MDSCHKISEVIKGAKDGVNVLEIRNVISKVSHGTLVDWRQPNCLHTQVHKVVQSGLNTFKGKIIILDYPVKKYMQLGVYAQAIYKMMWQQAIERRDVKIYPNPVFLWIDEAQYFINEN